MALYSYQAADASGRSVNGALEAKDEKALVDRLQEMGYYPIEIGKAEEPIPSVQASSYSLRGFFSKRISDKDVINFTQQLNSLLEAGIPLDKVLALLADLEKGDAFKEIILNIHKGIHSGATLADCLGKYPKVFPKTYVSMIRAGEAGGALETVLARLKDYLEEAQRLKEDIFSAMIYPALLIAVGGGAVALMVFFVLPKFSLIFSDMGGVMPLPTLVLLKTTEIIITYWWVLGLLTIVSVFGMRRFVSSEEGRLSYDRLKLRLPVFGSLLVKTVISRFSRTLGTLLHSGLPIVEALKIAKDTVGNKAISGELDSVMEGVQSGKGIALPLKQCRSFPQLAVHMLTVGEETGKLDEMLINLADNYDREISNMIKRLLALMEPAIILVMAVVVGFIVISLLLAIFSINDMPM